MIDIAKNFLKIIIITLTGLFITWFLLRGYGLQREFTQIKHPLLEIPKPLLFSLGGFSENKASKYTVQAFLNLREQNPQVIGTTRVFEAKDGTWVVAQKNELNPNQRIKDLTWPEIKKTAIEQEINLTSLDDLHSAGFAGPLALIVDEYAENQDRSLNSWIKKNKWDEKLFIISRHDGLLRDLRAINPNLLFSIGQAKLTQFLLLDTYSLEPLSRLRNDFILLDNRFAEKIKIKESTIVEVHRQKKFLIVEGINDKEVAQKLFDQGVDGVITESAEELVTILGQAL